MQEGGVGPNCRLGQSGCQSGRAAGGLGGEVCLQQGCVTPARDAVCRLSGQPHTHLKPSLLAGCWLGLKEHDAKAICALSHAMTAQNCKTKRIERASCKGIKMTDL